MMEFAASVHSLVECQAPRSST